MPISGEILDVNAGLESQPELVNQDPYNGGWMVKIKVSNSAELNDLLDVAAYKALIGH